MKSLETKISRVIVGKVEPNEDLVDSIIEMIKKYNIKSGFIKCIGALKTFTIGFYIIDSKEYKMKTFNENVELVSCMGSISYKNGEPIIHIHISVGRSDYSVIGGHLGKPSKVSITAEVSIYEIDQKLNRGIDSQTGLSLLSLK